MIKASVSKIKADFSEYVNRVAYGRERVIIMSRGKPKAVLMSFEDFHRFEALEDSAQSNTLRPQNKRLLELLQAAPPDELGEAWWADFERELAENRLSLRVVE